MANDQSMSFNIDKDDYKTFIQKLREAISQSTSHGIPVLMPQSGPLSWLDVQLIAGDHSITLRIDQRNLYVRGYSTNRISHFWEFNDSQMIPGSQSLRYSGSYADANGFPVSRKDLRLGSEPLREAIIALANMENPNSDTKLSARPLLIMIQMIAEATRIELIAAHIAANWMNSQTLTDRMIGAQNSWGTFSSAVQRAENTTGLPSTPLPPDVSNTNPMGILTVGHAATVFGILKWHEITQKVKRDVTQSSRAVTLTSHIRTLASIEFVRVNNIDVVQLYGTVTVNDCWGSRTVYERSSGNAESKRPGDCASLTGPSIVISGEDAFTISVSLWDHYRLLPDHEIAKGDIVWDPRKDSLYDTTLLADVGSVTVGYSVIGEAISATVDVRISGQADFSPANVYGMIKASSQSQSSTMLFDKSKNDYVQVLPQSSVPLTRKVVPAPVNSLLTIAVDLSDNADFSDYQIAQGSVQFTPQFGAQGKNITAGRYGEVNVTITGV